MSEARKPEELDRLAIGRTLNLKTITEMKEHERRLDKLIDWARSKGAQTTDDMIIEIKNLKNSIGNGNIYEMIVYTSLERERLEAEAGVKEAFTQANALKGKQKEIAEKMNKFKSDETDN